MKQHLRLFRFLSCLVAAGIVPAAVAAEHADVFRPIFNGTDLTGWDGDPKFWSVRDGAITGQTTAENPTRGNTFIIWRQGTLDNFELRLKYKIINGNSGIQYRSTDLGNWVVGGYQGDFEAGTTYSGILYHERGRGILAKRGEMTVVEPDGKPRVVASLGDTNDIQNAIKSEDWNDYHIIARGNQFTHIINGRVTVQVTDNDPERRKASGILALQLHAGPPMTVQFKDIQLKRLPLEDRKKIVFVPGRASHGYGAHEHRAGCLLLAKALNDNLASRVHAVVTDDGGWPTDPTVFDNADAVVFYCDGGGRHYVNDHLEDFNGVMGRGVGLTCLHYAVEVPKGPSGDRFLDWTGGYFETHWSVNPHWTAEFKRFPDHPIARGVAPFEINDEWYYHMRFRDNMDGVTPILTAVPPESTLQRPDGPHSGNPHVRAAKGQPQHVGWALQRDDGGRGFGFTGGHFHRNWGDENFRKVVLNAIVWTAHAEVPKNGVESRFTPEELEANQDEPKPAARAARKRDNQNQAKQANPKRRIPGAEFNSGVVDGDPVRIDVDIRESKELWLVVLDGGDGMGCDWADWADARLIGPEKSVHLSTLKWKSASSGWGQVRIDKNADGSPLRIQGQSYSNGIGTHAPSVIHYELGDHRFTRFQAIAGLDEGGTNQGCGSTVEFLVFTRKPAASVLNSVANRTDENATVRGAGPEAAQAALKTFTVPDGLELTVFASEPQLINPTNIDIDARGRVWVTEGANYRRWNNTRPEGDRIVILEDTDLDGAADKETIFYQGEEINSALGICVLGTKVIVSCSPRVMVFTDNNGDGRADGPPEILFNGIGGVQHDHGAHAFTFGPDGHLYFNVGNNGGQLKTPDGSEFIVDMAGNPVNGSGNPYRQGLVFRCRLDGSQVETLGYNFRNNYEVAVDSFGTLWQSDNDDDGNRSVRINYVMEFGNFGYTDEMTGAGWQTQRTNMEAEIPERHWHQNDPGVVPNLLTTGAGSPTGIVVYEGDLLPEPFRGQVLHCDAGPRVVRAYPVKPDGAGYRAEIENLVTSSDTWFRPSDVCVAPDGSVYIADWNDPGVGGHNMGDRELSSMRGRIYRVAPSGHKPRVPPLDNRSARGAALALQSPNQAMRYEGWTALHQMKGEAESALLALWNGDQPRMRARALQLLARIPGKERQYIEAGLRDRDPDIRIAALRIARNLDWPAIMAATPAEATRDLAKRSATNALFGALGDALQGKKPDLAAGARDVAGSLSFSLPDAIAMVVGDASPRVRREAAIALRHLKAPEAPDLWASLAAQHNAGDRWYLEALGIGADRQEDAFFDAWLAKAGSDWNNPAGRDVVWRSRATRTPGYLVRIIKSPATSDAEKARYIRALDFIKGPEKEKALIELLTSN